MKAIILVRTEHAYYKRRHVIGRLDKTQDVVFMRGDAFRVYPPTKERGNWSEGIRLCSARTKTEAVKMVGFIFRDRFVPGLREKT